MRVWGAVWGAAPPSQKNVTVRIPRIYPCVRSIPVKNEKKLFYFLVWHLSWNWNWDGSWNDLRERPKLWGGFGILYYNYTGGFAPPITSIQNAQASPEFLTLPQVIPTSIPIPISHKSVFVPFHFSSDTEFRNSPLHVM